MGCVGGIVTCCLLGGCLRLRLMPGRLRMAAHAQGCTIDSCRRVVRPLGLSGLGCAQGSPLSGDARCAAASAAALSAAAHGSHGLCVVPGAGAASIPLGIFFPVKMPAGQEQQSSPAWYCSCCTAYTLPPAQTHRCVLFVHHLLSSRCESQCVASLQQEDGAPGWSPGWSPGAVSTGHRLRCGSP
jgi:hypothetical protein